MSERCVTCGREKPAERVVTGKELLHRLSLLVLSGFGALGIVRHFGAGQYIQMGAFFAALYLACAPLFPTKDDPDPRV